MAEGEGYLWPLCYIMSMYTPEEQSVTVIVTQLHSLNKTYACIKYIFFHGATDSFTSQMHFMDVTQFGYKPI